MRFAPLLALACVALTPAPYPLLGQVLLTQDEALELAFPPPATVERATAFLGAPERERVEAVAGGEARAIPRVVPYYVGRRDGTPLGVAYFDAHRVRTMQEVVMVVVSPAGTVERVDVLHFLEPPEYMAPGPWIDQLTGAPLSDDLAVNRGIVNLTGATLTAEAITRAVRRVLALNQVIRPLAATVRGGRN